MPALFEHHPLPLVIFIVEKECAGDVSCWLCADNFYFESSSSAFGYCLKCKQVVLTIIPFVSISWNLDKQKVQE